jgi:hypothetical protein
VDDGLHGVGARLLAPVRTLQGRHGLYLPPS